MIHTRHFQEMFFDAFRSNYADWPFEIKNGHNFSRWPPTWLILVKIFAVVML